MLEQSDIAHYLLSLDVVKPRAVVEGDLTIRDASRRNCVFLVSTSAEPTFVVKQAGPLNTAALAHEAKVLRFLAGTPAIAGHVPTVIFDDALQGRLVLRTPGGAHDWAQHHRNGRVPRMPPRVLGRVLGALHGLPGDTVGRAPAGSDPMWGLSLAEPPHELRLGLSAVAQDLLGRIQAADALCRQLERLRSTVPNGALVHGDLRWENCLAVAGPGSWRRTRALLIDWELAGSGAAGFDAGTVIAEYLRFWVGSIPIVEPADPGRLAARATHPLDRMVPAVRAFWAAYSAANPLRPALRQVVELAAVRLLQTAVERAQGLTAPSAHVVTLVQLADNMLRHPEDAALTLLGLSE